MEIADCKVKLGGDQNNIVTKFDVTPAEVIVLMNLHGPGSVIDIKIKTLTKAGKDPRARSHRFEMQRLRGIYQGDPGVSDSDITGAVGSNSGNGINSPSIDRIVNKLFPGISPVLPVSFSDIVFTQEEEEEDGDATVEPQETGDVDPEPVKAATPKAKPGRKRTRVVEEQPEEITV